MDLPAKAVYVSSAGNGVYDAASHSVTFTNGPRAWQEDPSVTVRFPSSAYPTTGDGCVVPETFTVHDASLTYLDGTVKASNPQRLGDRHGGQLRPIRQGGPGQELVHLRRHVHLHHLEHPHDGSEAPTTSSGTSSPPTRRTSPGSRPSSTTPWTRRICP